MSADPAWLTLPQLFACGAALLMRVGASSWTLLRQDKARRRLLVRIDAIATPYARANPLLEMAGATRRSPAATGYGPPAPDCSAMTRRAPVITP